MNDSRVCCGDCFHSGISPESDPTYGWRRCGQGKGGGFARALRHCDAFKPILPISEADPAKVLARRIYAGIRSGELSWNRNRLREQLNATDADVEAAIRASKGHLMLNGAGIISAVQITRARA